jgi:hypothetical protein
MRRVYGQGRIKTLAKLGVLTVAYLLLTVAAFAGYVLLLLLLV